MLHFLRFYYLLYTSFSLFFFYILFSSSSSSSSPPPPSLLLILRPCLLLPVYSSVCRGGCGYEERGFLLFVILVFLYPLSFLPSPLHHSFSLCFSLPLIVLLLSFSIPSSVFNISFYDLKTRAVSG